MKKELLLAGCLSVAVMANAQLSSNPDKFLGNITTSGNVEFGNEKYYTLWNQITCENESKWQSVEGNNNNFNWGCDRAYNYAKEHGFPFKFHALIWGAQYPTWLEAQTPQQRYKEIVQWMDAVKQRYPDLQLIDVVNEAIDGHQGGTKYFIEALGGKGETGYDWIIKAFELAYERWPNAILIYNDFNTFQWNTSQFIDIVKTLRDAGAPIDAYGCQSHDLTNCSSSTFKNSMTTLQNALKMPMYSTEYDIGTTDDALQLQRYKEQIPYMWEQDYVAGVTLWGYIYGRTWTNDGKDENGNTINSGHSGIIKNGVDRPAMTWLREYMQTDAAKKAKSPFPGMKKEASVYIKPQAKSIEKGQPTKFTVRAAMRTKTIEKIDFYVGSTLVSTLTEAPYVVDYTPTTTGNLTFKAVVTTTDGSKYERYGAVTSASPRTTYQSLPIELPGVLEAENFDKGADGIAFHDSNSNKQGNASSYRTDTGGIDIERGGTGYTVGYTEIGEWMEYTVDVKEAGMYDYDIEYSAPASNPEISISLHDADGLTLLTPKNLALPNTGDWSKFKKVHGRLLLPLKEGRQILRIAIVGGTDTYILNLDKVTFSKVNVNNDIDISFASAPREAMLTIKNPITPDISSETEIKSVKYYIDGTYFTTVTEAPFTFQYEPTVKGMYNIMAIATDVNDKVSEIASYDVKVSQFRAPFKPVDIPGIVQAEDFDKGEEGYSFHDSDAKDDGASGYRTDNEGVDIFKIDDRYAVNSKAAEWMEYTVNVKEAGNYKCKVTVANNADATLNLKISKMEGEEATDLWYNTRITKTKVPYSNPVTFVEYEFSQGVDLAEGKLVVRFTAAGGDLYLDKFELINTTSTGIESAAGVSDCAYTVYNLSGNKLGTVKAHGSSDLKQQIATKAGKSGIFIIKNEATGKAEKVSVK